MAVADMQRRGAYRSGHQGRYDPVPGATGAGGHRHRRAGCRRGVSSRPGLSCPKDSAMTDRDFSPTDATGLGLPPLHGLPVGMAIKIGVLSPNPRNFWNPYDSTS